MNLIWIFPLFRLLDSHYFLLVIQTRHLLLKQRYLLLLMSLLLEVHQYLFQGHVKQDGLQKQFFHLYRQAKHVVHLKHRSLYQQCINHFLHDNVQQMSISYQLCDFPIFLHLSRSIDQVNEHFFPNHYLFSQAFLDCEPLVFNKVDTKLPRNREEVLGHFHVELMSYLQRVNHRCRSCLHFLSRPFSIQLDQT